MTEKLNIIFLSYEPWDMGHHTDSSRLAFELARNHRLLFINPAVDQQLVRKQPNHPLVRKRTRVLRGIEDEVIHVADNIWTLYLPIAVRSLRQIQNPIAFDFLNYFNNKKIAEYIKKSCEKINFSDPILFNSGELFRSYYLNKFLKPSLFVYYLQKSQAIYAQKRWHGIRLEPKLIAKADLVLAGSQPLANSAKEINPFSHFVGNGYDAQTYLDAHNQPTPDDLLHIPRPIIGYIGSLRADRLDYKLLLHLAKSRPQWSFVLIGPEDTTFIESELHALPNVFFPGNKNIYQLPQYLNAFNVAIDPLHASSSKKVHYPRKVDEYLAMGKPVVATRTQASEFFKDFIQLANNFEEFVEKIESQLGNQSLSARNARIEFAKKHTWQQVAQTAMQLIEERLISKKIELH